MSVFIRNSKGRFVSNRALVDRAEELKRAGFTLYYAWPEDAKTLGYLSSSALSGDYLGGYRVRTVTGDPSEAYGHPYVLFGDVARGECSHGQADTVVRSNYIAIRRDFPDFPWVDTAYMNVNELGAWVADLDDEMTALFIGLKESYPVYDETAMGELEQEEIEASWDGWMRSEVWRELPEVTRTIMWDALGEDRVTALWWACVSAGVFGSYPEHLGVEVAWGDVRDRASEFREVIIRAYVTQRRGIEVNDEYRFVDMMQRIKGGY